VSTSTTRCDCSAVKEKVSSIEVPLRRCGRGHEANLSRWEKLSVNCCRRLGEYEVGREIRVFQRQ
jgi:hypothetical protein